MLVLEARVSGEHEKRLRAAFESGAAYEMSDAEYIALVRQPLTTGRVRYLLVEATEVRSLD